MADYILDWNKYTETAITAAEEGAVLVKNNDRALPFEKGTKVAVFGRMQDNYYKSGTGSGGMVNVSHVVSILEGLENDPDIEVDQELKQIYIDWQSGNPMDPGVGWGREKWSQDEMRFTDDLAKKMAEKNDAAIVIIARTAGEDRDNTADKGSYYLNDSEEEMLEKVCSSFDRVVVLLNVGNIIDMSFVEKYNPSAVMYVWQCGMIGGTAAANLVTGKATPSGSLTDTIAKELTDYPSDANFGKKDLFKDQYAEDVYVGYRYFSTFAPEKVLYPFGWGLSYTDFSFEAIDATIEDGAVVRVKVEVTNTGDTKGKKTVEIYAQAPVDKIGKPSLVMVDFAKTRELMPGETEVLEMVITPDRFASYDDDNRAGLGTGWILEKGVYTFYLGDNVRDAFEVFEYEMAESINIEPLASALKPTESYQRMNNVPDEDGNPTLVYEDVAVREIDYLADRMSRVAPEIPQTGDKGIKLTDVKSGKATMDEFIAQIDDEQLTLIIRGEGMSSPKVTTGTAAGFAGLSKELHAMGIPAVCCSDGPSGMRIDSGKKAFSIPNGTCLASTFNEELMVELFTWFGIEMVDNQIDAILGPGINIHRHPLNGRNFEYFSEDPLLTGRMAAAQIEGLEKHGVTAVIKHFCMNNRETKRREMDSVCSERALREIYLKGFEIAVKEGGARSIMTVYNKVNGVYGAGNYDLNTMILREQWGFKGIVMTDWWAFIDSVPEILYSHQITELSLMARAQNDLYMVSSMVERKNLNEVDTYECLTGGQTDRITRAELQRNAKNILEFAMNTPAMDRMEGHPREVEHFDCPFAGDTIEAKVDVYYNIDENPVIEVEADTTTGGDFTFGVICENPGFYKVEYTGSSPLNPLAQIPMTVFYTSIPIDVITWNGTEGKDDTKVGEVRLGSTYAIFRLHFVGSGIQIKQIKYTFDRPFSADPNFFEKKDEE